MGDSQIEKEGALHPPLSKTLALENLPCQAEGSSYSREIPFEVVSG